MLLYKFYCSLDVFATVASIIIAAFAVLQFTYLVFIQAKKEKKRNKKEWFHRLVIEPKIEEVYEFFEKSESEFEDLKNLFNNGDFSLQSSLNKAEKFKVLIYKFRRSFVDLVDPIDNDLAVKIQGLVDDLLDFYTEKLFSDSFKLTDVKLIYNKFYRVQSQIIYLLYRWKN